MACYQPTRVVRAPNGEIQFNKDWRHASSFTGHTVMNLPCRRCIGCNTSTAREWALRGFHEALLHTHDWRDKNTGIVTSIPNSSVVTLTYADEHLPEDGALRHSDFQKFMKRLRFSRPGRSSAKSKNKKTPLRYFMCGEYGGRTQRPHYHAVIYGETFDDRYSEQSKDGQCNQMSYELDNLWGMGRATVDDFTFAGASYVAGYVAKKTHIEGHQGPTKTTINRHTGEVNVQPISPEYRKMSTHPGLGADWILNPANMARTYQTDSIKICEWEFHPPRYYDVLMKRHRPDLVAAVQAKRRDGTAAAAAEWTPERCTAAEQIALASLQQRRDSL